jgi:hypothetical protein
MARKKREETETVVTSAAKLAARLRETSRLVREGADDFDTAGLLLVAADEIEAAEHFAALQRSQLEEIRDSMERMRRDARAPQDAPDAAAPPRPRRGRPPKPEAAPAAIEPAGVAVPEMST